MKDFFVSYTGNDRDWAEWIAFVLEQEGYSVSIQAWDFRPGSNFVLEMDRAAKESKRTIAVLSSRYLNAVYPQPEWANAFRQDPAGTKRLLLPVRIERCDIKGLLGPIVYIDLVGRSKEDARKALLEGVNPRRVKPADEPPFPGAG